MIFNTFKRLTIAAILASTCASGVLADLNAGAYLAGRSAGAGNDFVAGVTYFERALDADPTNPRLLNAALVAHIGIGDFEGALGISEAMLLTGVSNSTSNLVLATDAFVRHDYNAYFDGLASGNIVGPLIDGLGQGWAFVGKGEMDPALAAFDAVANSAGLRALGMYHKGLALASVGDFESADAIFTSNRDEGLTQTRRAVIAHAQTLSQLDRNDDALALMDETFGPRLDPVLATLRLRLAAGEPVPFDLVTSPRQGLAEALFTLAQILNNDVSDTLVLINSRMIEVLNPDHIQALLLTGEKLTDLEQFDLATAVFAQIPPENPHFLAAEIDRANAFIQAGRIETAIEVLAQLSRSHPEQPNVWLSLGTAHARNRDYPRAEEAYTRSLEIFSRTGTPSWAVYFRRGTSRYLQDNWLGAEADLRQAVALNPDQPQVLNYLGYSYVERDENLDEALEMIERAVLLAPNNGAIIDSLGWAFFQLDRYADAVIPMERAAQLEATDAVVNDHLGDVYWAVGREIEAHFQWQRALSFDPDEDTATRIRLKIEIGLDAVLESEGADPLQRIDVQR